MIKRVEWPYDAEVDDDVIQQHGVFMIEDTEICTVKIISQHDAVVSLRDSQYLDALIDEFRYYAEHITTFYDQQMQLLKKFPDIVIHEIDLLALQPSQFYINESKLAAITTFVNNKKDVIIPVNKRNGDTIILDGHTRLYVAYQKGIDTVYFYESAEQVEMDDFVQAAQSRNIRNIKDCIVLNEEAYKKEWIGYCEAYYNNKKG